MKAFYYQPDAKDNGCTGSPACGGMPCGSGCGDTPFGGGWYTCPHPACSASHYHTTPTCHGTWSPGASTILSGIRIEDGQELVLKAPHVNPSAHEMYLEYADDPPNPNIRIASGAGKLEEIVNIDNGQPEWRLIPREVKNNGGSPSSLKLQSEGKHGNNYLRSRGDWVAADADQQQGSVFDVQVVSDIGIQLKVDGNAVYAKRGDDGVSVYLSADGGSSRAVTFWIYVVGLPNKP